VPLLDEYDGHRRPLALVYDPFSRTSAAAAAARVVLVARPGMRTEPQPLTLMWNARFSLPPGDYLFEMARPAAAAAESAKVGLQIGRAGTPLDEWTVEGPSWQRRVSLPLDAPLVGLRPLAPASLADGELRITPIRIVDQSRRIERPGIVSARRYGRVTAFFHDDFSPGEANGFWTRGGGTTQVTFVTAADDPAAIHATVHCGAVANRVTIHVAGAVERFDLQSGATRQISVPTILHPEIGVRSAPLDVAARGGFVPADIDRTSTDRRRLGCWIEVR
jgi:hypothetical protein